ncbi:MAG: division/cell wall cluster transcriptional repressor MraZ [Pseudomonadota bacterium]
MFRGINTATLDGKGRMALPTRYRETLALACAGQVVVTIDMRETCLLLYPLPEWEVVQRKLEGLSNINNQARMLQRLLIGHATDLELDSNGRILLPAMLRDFANLSKKLVVVGQGNKLELWAEEIWHEQVSNWRDEAGASELGQDDVFNGLSV